jgi:hypothetical protein
MFCKKLNLEQISYSLWKWNQNFLFPFSAVCKSCRPITFLGYVYAIFSVDSKSAVFCMFFIPTSNFGGGENFLGFYLHILKTLNQNASFACLPLARPFPPILYSEKTIPFQPSVFYHLPPLTRLQIFVVLPNSVPAEDWLRLHVCRSFYKHGPN